MLSIIIPHKITVENNKALQLNLQMLLANTRSSYELIIDTECPKDPYRIWNEAAAHARGDFLVFSNSDVLMAPDWDTNLLKYCEYNTIVAGYLVEPGTIGVASENIHKDFGRTPDTFDRVAFENYALSSHAPEVVQERAWYMPCCIRKEWFLHTGGFSVEIPFPNPNDILFWNHCKAAYNTRFIRVKSFAYHFQNLSGR
jgi:hypothetical protein